MEGAGSRMSRASSRYGSTAVFNGPVRKWKKRWVHVSSPTAPTNGHGKAHLHSGGSTVFLCRWTPIGGAGNSAGEGDGLSGSGEEPPKRKFRYTPIAVLEEQSKARKTEEEGMSENLQSTEKPTVEYGFNYRKLSMGETVKNENQESTANILDLDLSLEDPNKDHGDIEGRRDAKMQSTNGGLWSKGGPPGT